MSNLMKRLTNSMSRRRKHVKSKFQTIQDVNEFQRFLLHLVDQENPDKAGIEYHFVNKILFNITMEVNANDEE